jgi:hypothetical protein
MTIENIIISQKSWPNRTKKLFLNPIRPLKNYLDIPRRTFTLSLAKDFTKFHDSMEIHAWAKLEGH